MGATTRRRFLWLSLAACAAGAIAACENEHDISSTIAYGTGPRQQLDVYAPETGAHANRPVVVYFYGGAWQSGQRSDSRGVARALVSQGIVAIAADYRSYPDAVF